MTRRMLVSSGLAATAAIVATIAPLVHGQAAGQEIGAGTPPLVITAYNGGPPIAYTVPRTPWGDPDLQGTWSSDDTANIPGSRALVDGKPNPNLYLTDEQYKTRQAAVAKGVQSGENAEGSFRGDFARRAFRQSSTIVDPPDGRMPSVTAEAKKRAAPRDQGTFGNGPFNSVQDFTLYDRCITRGVWGSVMRVIYGNGNRIVQAPGMVAISYEMIHDTRIFYTDGRPHLNNAIRQYLGDSRARWDGDTLVVETTNLTDQTSIGANGNGLRHSDRMKIVERFKRVANDILQYQITIDDPVTYERQVHGVAAAHPARRRSPAPLRLPRRQPRRPTVARGGARGRRGARGGSGQGDQARAPAHSGRARGWRSADRPARGRAGGTVDSRVRSSRFLVLGSCSGFGSGFGVRVRGSGSRSSFRFGGRFSDPRNQEPNLEPELRSGNREPRTVQSFT